MNTLHGQTVFQNHSPTKRAPDAGDCRLRRRAQFQAFSYAVTFFWLDGFAVPAPAQVSPKGDDGANRSAAVPVMPFAGEK